MDARVRSVVVCVLMCWCGGLVSGEDWMLHTPGGGPIEDRCPCLPVGLCPRPFGLSPHDVRQFGHLPVCMDASYVRCCGASFSVHISPPTLLTIPDKLAHNTVDLHIKLHSGLDGIELYDSSAGDLIDERQNPQELKRSSEKAKVEPVTQNDTVPEDKATIIVETNDTTVTDISTVTDEYDEEMDEMDNVFAENELYTFGNSSSEEYEGDSEESTEVTDARNNTTSTTPMADLMTPSSDEINDTVSNGEANNTTASTDESTTHERLSVSISISFSTSESNRNDSSFEDAGAVYPKANATCEEIQILIEQLKKVKQEEWKDKVLGHVRDSYNFSSENRTEEDVVLVYPVNDRRRSNDKADIDVSIVYPMNSICARIWEKSPDDQSKNSSATSNTSTLENNHENVATGAFNETGPFHSSVKTDNSSDTFEIQLEITQRNISGLQNASQIQNVQKINESEEIAGYKVADEKSDIGAKSTDSDFDDPGTKKNLTSAEEPNAITTDGHKKNTTQDDLNNKLQSRRMLFGQRLRQKSAQKVVNTTHTSVQRNRTRLVDLYSKYSRQSPLGRSSKFQTGNVKANTTSVKNLTSEEDDLQNATELESHSSEMEFGNDTERPVGESRSIQTQQNVNSYQIKRFSTEEDTESHTTTTEHKDSENYPQESSMFVTSGKLLSPVEQIEEEIQLVGSKIDRKHRSRSVTAQRERGRRYNHFLRNYKRDERKEAENDRFQIVSGGNKNDSIENVSLSHSETNISTVNTRNDHENNTESTNKEIIISNPRNVGLRTLPSARVSKNQRGRIFDGLKGHRVVAKTSVTDIEDLQNKTFGTNGSVSVLESTSTPSSLPGTKHSERINLGGHTRVRVVKRLRGKSGKLRNTAAVEPHSTDTIISGNSSYSEGPSVDEKHEVLNRLKGKLGKTGNTTVDEAPNPEKAFSGNLSNSEGLLVNDKHEVVKRLRGISGKTRNTAVEKSPNPEKITPENSSNSEGPSTDEKNEVIANVENNRTWTIRGVERYRLSKSSLFFPVRTKSKKNEPVGLRELPPEHHSKTLEPSISEEALDSKSTVLRDGRDTFKTPSTMERGFIPMESSRNEDSTWEKRKKIAEMELQNPLVFQLPQEPEPERQKTIFVSSLTAAGQDLRLSSTPIIKAANVSSTVTPQNNFSNQEKPLGHPDNKDLLKSFNTHHNNLLGQLNELGQTGFTITQSVTQKTPGLQHTLHDDKGKLMNHLKQLEEAVEDVRKLKQLQQSLTPVSVSQPVIVQQPQHWTHQWLEGFTKTKQFRPDGHLQRPQEDFHASPPDLTQNGSPVLTQPDHGPQRLTLQGQVFRETDQEEEQLITMMQQMLPPPLPFFRDSPSQFPKEFNPVPQKQPDPQEQYYQQLQKYHQQQVQYYQGLRQFLSMFPGLNIKTVP